MFCVRCGKYNPDTKKVCQYCGGELSSSTNYRKSSVEENYYGGEKTLVGVLMCLFLGLLGLILGLIIYSGYERDTFIKGWVKAFIVSILIGIIAGGFVACLFLTRV